MDGGEDGRYADVLRVAYAVARRKFSFGHFDAEDIAQEMAIRSMLRARVAPVNLAWVSLGATYLCIDLLRASASERNLRARYANEAGGLAVRAAGNPEWLDVHAAVARLPEQWRNVVRGYYWDGMTFDELDRQFHHGQRASQYQAKKSLACLRRALMRTPLRRRTADDQECRRE